MTVKVTFAEPFSSFPEAIAERTGYLIAPSFWDNPDRSSALMVGTGAFTMTEWTRGEQTVLTANPDYWRTDANGEQLPYLDEVVFRPVPDVSTRRATMESGDADVNMDSFGENLEFWRTDWVDEGNGSVVPDPARETTYLLINNESPPFDNPDMRRALALCTDRDEYLAFRAPGNDDRQRAVRRGFARLPGGSRVPWSSTPTRATRCSTRSAARRRSCTAPPTCRRTCSPPSCSPTCGARTAG